MRTAHFQIVYDGPALADHQMDVRDLAPALMAISDMLEEANTILNGDRATVSVRVKGSFKTGSFGVEFGVSQSIVQQFMDFISCKEFQTASAILALLGLSAKDGVRSLMSVIKWMRRRKIKSVEDIGNNSSRIITEDDESLDLEKRVIELLESPRIRKAVEKAVYQPLSRDGVERFAVVDVVDGTVNVIAKREEREHFISPTVETNGEVTDTVNDMMLYIVSLSFSEGYKWRFSDGSGTNFTADIKDKDFLNIVDAGEVAFAQGDMLRVEMRTIQEIRDGKVQTKRDIQRVIKHVPAPQQTRITFPGLSGKPE